jgi:hypothetical protein
MIRFSVLFSGLVVVGGIAAVAVPVSGASAGASVAVSRGVSCQSVNFTSFSQADQESTLSYWTPVNMGNAKPENPATESTVPLSELEAATTSECVLIPATAGTSPVPASSTTSGSGATAQSTWINGYPPEGELFVGKHAFCSGSVLADGSSGTDSLVLTAAHCVVGERDGKVYLNKGAVFVPQYHQGKSPFGRWKAIGFAWKNWITCSNGECKTHPEYDYAIMVLAKVDGKRIGTVTGENGWGYNTGTSVSNVRLIGYPGYYAKDNKQGKRIPLSKQRPLTTVGTASAVPESGLPYWRIKSPDFTDGTSGSPWLVEFGQQFPGLGVTIADLGGYERGGVNPSPSYASDWAFDLSSFEAVVAEAAKKQG